MHYNWYRYYDPTSGRYLQTEPILQDPSIARHLALLFPGSGPELVVGSAYVYGVGSPQNYIDPDGRNPILFGFIGGGVGAAANVTGTYLANYYMGTSGTFGQYAGAAASGFVGGFLAGSTAGVSTPLSPITGLVLDMAGNTMSNFLDLGHIPSPQPKPQLPEPSSPWKPTGPGSPPGSPSDPGGSPDPSGELPGHPGTPGSPARCP